MFSLYAIDIFKELQYILKVMYDAGNISHLKWRILLRLVLGCFFMGCVFFIPAGTIQYPEAWLYITWMGACMISMMSFLMKKDPALLQRRLRMKEKEKEQKRLLKFSYVVFAAIFLIPGFDKRFGWSAVGEIYVIAAFVILFLGYLLFAAVLWENRYASRIVEVVPEQKVITTGPYKYVRHPMYSAILLIYLATPVALGSYWAITGGVFIPVVLYYRIRNEEKVLSAKLSGYAEYQRQTPYRLIPGIW
jgi:protein-S-isoprenylcysteine O-methyltransferase Ste14